LPSHLQLCFDNPGEFIRGPPIPSLPLPLLYFTSVPPSTKYNLNCLKQCPSHTNAFLPHPFFVATAAVSCYFECSLRCLCHWRIFYEILSLCCWLRHPISEVPHGLSRYYLAEPFHPKVLLTYAFSRLRLETRIYSYTCTREACKCAWHHFLGVRLYSDSISVIDIRKECCLILPSQCNTVILSSCICQFCL
jgi:hypothetical protein